MSAGGVFRRSVSVDVDFVCPPLPIDPPPLRQKIRKSFDAAVSSRSGGWCSGNLVDSTKMERDKIYPRGSQTAAVVTRVIEKDLTENDL